MNDPKAFDIEMNGQVARVSDHTIKSARIFHIVFQSRRVSNPENSARWYPGSGIYRNVWLAKTNPVHIGQWGTCITTPHISKTSANVDLKVTVENNSAKVTTVKLTTSIFDTGRNGLKTGPAIGSFTTATANISSGVLQISPSTANVKKLAEIGKVRTPSRSSYFGIVDLAGFKKDRFYLSQLRWRPDLPMAHILPHWNWPGMVGHIGPIHVYTSGNEAEVFLNGKSLERKKKEPYQSRLRWDSVVYEPGTVKVIAYKNGKKWAEDVVKTTGEATQLKLQADRAVIKSGVDDLPFITVTIVDKDGQTVPQSNNLIKFNITGSGEIAGTDNGDATSFESFLGKQHKVFNGMALFIVRSKAGSGGKITLTAEAEGLKAGTIVIESKTQPNE